MSMKAGMFALVGPLAMVPGCPTVLSFPELPRARREAILNFWQFSPIPLVRKARPPRLWRVPPLRRQVLAN